jgi:uncharacterized membrane protein YcgQ (UPF0703/DUF1980 family)
MYLEHIQINKRENQRKKRKRIVTKNNYKLSCEQMLIEINLFNTKNIVCNEFISKKNRTEKNQFSCHCLRMGHFCPNMFQRLLFLRFESIIF